jgi:hypothetical protein
MCDQPSDAMLWKTLSRRINAWKSAAMWIYGSINLLILPCYVSLAASG